MWQHVVEWHVCCVLCRVKISFCTAHNTHVALRHAAISPYIYINEELNDSYPSPNIVRVIKSRRMRWAGHVARMGEERGV